MRTAPLMHWRRALWLGVLVVIACAVLPFETAVLVAEVAGVVGMTLLWRGVRRNGARDLRPFALMVAGGSSFLVGNVVRAVHGITGGVDNPFPSPADVIYYVGYGLIIAGIVLLVRRRSAQIEGDNVLDALLVAMCLGVLTLIFVVQPYLGNHDIGGLERAMTLLYTLLDLVLVSCIVRLAVGSGRRSHSYYLLGGAVGFVVLTDIFLTLSASSTAAQRLGVSVAPLCYMLAAAAGMHPSIAHLTDPPALRDIQLTHRRLSLLFAAVIGMVVLLVVTVVSHDQARVTVASAGSVAAVLIVLARLALLVQSNERKAAREATLRDAAGALARATSVNEMHHIASSVLADVVPGSSTWIIDLDAGDGVVVATSGPSRPDAEISLIATRAQRALDHNADDHAVCARPITGEVRLVLASPVQVRRGHSAQLVAATDEPVARQLLDAMDTIALQLAGAIDGLLLAEDIYRREQEQRFRALVEHSSDMVTVLDADGLVTFASPACRELLGAREAELIGRHPFERVHPEDRFSAASLLDRSWAVPGVLDPMEVRFEHMNGEWRWFEILVENLLDQPEIGAVIIHSRDVTDRRRAQEEVSAREARFRSLVQHNADLIAIVDDDLRLQYVSPAARGMLGYEPDSLVGRLITDLIPADQLFVDNGMLPSMSEAQVRDVSGEWRTVELTITDLRNDSAVAGIVINARDVSERKTLESKLRFLAMHDPLTGLANRNLLHERLATALRSPDAAVAVLYIDIDDFKSLNDSLGHGFGDTALCEVARRLTAGIREGGDLAARLGGDEFAVLLEGPGAQNPMEVGERLLDAVRAPILLGSHRVHLTVSLGVAVREPESTVSTLTRNADIAMYLAKTDGKDRRQLFEPSMLESFNTRIELKRDLQEVIERGELRVVYQPVYETATGRMTSVEALVRWDHPTRGLVAPLQFIPLAEETGHIREIGAWVLEESCKQLAAWRAAGAPDDLSMSVNLSVAQLEEDGLIGMVERTLLSHGIEPAQLMLEVTESVLAADIDLVQLQLTGLSSLGVRLALDDFGTGYSSLGYLQHFQLDTLKIDRTFLGEADPAQQEGLLRAIIELAGNRGMQTTAEGVEHEGQLALLTKLGCTAVQGFLFAKPLPPDEVLGALGRAIPYVQSLDEPVAVVG